jgi:Ser/Thr protein kinase RdoA (MazF antagonist)
MMIFPTAYSSVSTKALLQLVVEKYPIIGKVEICYLKRGFNDTYLVKTEGEKFILRIYKYNWRTYESIETELKLLQYLKENAISVSFPIVDKNEKTIQTINAAEGNRYAVLFSFAEGNVVRKLSVEQSFMLGVETGKIHSLTKNISFGQTAQDYNIESQFSNALNTLKPVLIEFEVEYNSLILLQDDFIKLFKNINMNEISMGICHGDLQSENFHIIDTNNFTFFDFDFFGKGYLAYDIGVFMWYDHKNKGHDIMKSFLKGYQTQNKLSELEIKLIPYFSALRAVFQMTMYCNLSNGELLPIWPADQVADFVKKINKWVLQNCKRL